MNTEINRFAILIANNMEETTLLLWGDNGWIYRKCPGPQPVTLGMLADVGLRANLTHLWVFPGIVTPDKAYAVWDSTFKSISVRYDDSDKHIAVANALKSEDHKGRRQLTIIFPEYGKWAWVPKCPSPKVMYITIKYIQDALGVAIAGSAGPVGWVLLKKIHPDYDAKGIETVDLNAMHFGEGCEELIWESPALGTGLTGYLHKADRSMAFTAAASGADARYGVGIPQHVGRVATQVNDCTTLKFNYKDVGVYKCNITGKDNPLLPPVWPGKKKNVWIASPQVRMLMFRGYDVEITEAFIFPESYALLDKWGKFLWDARVSFETDTQKWKHPIARALAAKAIKEIANSLIGYLRYANFEDKYADRRRTDIRTQTISRNVELVYHNILTVERTDRVRPVMVYVDALYYITNSPDARADIPSLFKREGQLGGYKYEGSIELTPQVETILANRSLGTSQKLQLLNKIGWSK